MELKQNAIADLMSRKKFKQDGDIFSRVIEGQKVDITNSEIEAQKDIEHLRLLIEYKVDLAFADAKDSEV